MTSTVSPQHPGGSPGPARSQARVPGVRDVPWGHGTCCTVARPRVGSVLGLARRLRRHACSRPARRRAVMPVVGAAGRGPGQRRGLRLAARPSSRSRRCPSGPGSCGADGSLIATFYYENRVLVPLTKVAPMMRQATIAIEDSRFYEHGGIDLRARCAPSSTTSPARTQGGSTLTQQYVKQVLLEQRRHRGRRRPPSRPPRPTSPTAASCASCSYAVAPRGEVHQGADPRALPQHRLLRRRRRTASRPPPSTTSIQERRRPDPAAGRAAGRHRAAARRLRPDRTTRDAALDPPQHRAGPDGSRRAGHPGGADAAAASTELGLKLAKRSVQNGCNGRRRPRSSATSCSRRSSTTRAFGATPSRPRAACCCAAGSPSRPPSTRQAAGAPRRRSTTT